MTGLRDFWRAEGAATFGIVWVGQLVSNLGSAMTQFGLAIWVFEETGSVTQLALIVAAARVPQLFVSPFAGALVDRWNRRAAMLLSDAGAALGTLATLLLLTTGWFEIWHLYVTLSVSGLFTAFQFPAYSAAVTLLIPPAQYTRASGLVQLAGSVGLIVAPPLAAAVVVAGGLAPVFAIDLATFGVAVATLVAVRIPATPPSEEETAAGGRGLVASLAAEVRAGLDFVLERRALLILMLSFVMVNFAFAFQGVLVWPLLLNLASEQTAGLVVGAGAVGLVAGTLVLSVWGGPTDRVKGVYLPIGAMGLGLVVQGLRPEVWLVLAGLLLIQSTHPIAGGSSQSIWQSKVPPGLQGRVFAIRQVSAIAASPVAFLAAGTLADRVFEPWMTAPSPLVQWLFGAGPGRGIGVMFALSGLFALAVAGWAIRHPRIRGLEAGIPDLAT